MLPGRWPCPLHTPCSLKAHVETGRSGVGLFYPLPGLGTQPTASDLFWGKKGSVRGAGCHTPGWCVGGCIDVPRLWQGGWQRCGTSLCLSHPLTRQSPA